MPASPGHFKLALMANTLGQCRFFKGLPPADLEEIASFSVLRSLSKGEYLFHEGGPAEGFYVVQKGAVNVHRTNAAGREQILHIFRAGEVFAEAALASDTGYPADARATEDTTLVMVPRIPFLGLFRARPELALRMLASLGQHLRTLVALVDDLTLKDMETRLANWLLKRCPQPLRSAPATIALEQSKKILAGEMGATSETFSRALAKFREQGMLKVEGSELTVTDPLALQRLIERHLAGPGASPS